MGTLTVRENLMFSANLRLPNSLSQKDKSQRVEEILQKLDLTSCADTRVSRIILLHCPHGNIAKFNVTARVWGLFKTWMFNNSEIYYQRWSCRWRWLRVMPPSHQTKTMKTALRPENLDERSAVVVKKEKCAVFEFILRIYHVPGRFSLRLTRLCQVLTTSNTFPLISYHVRYHARTTSMRS